MRTTLTEKIRNKIREKFLFAEKQQLTFLDLYSSKLYEEIRVELNLPPKPDHRMPICCNAMCSFYDKDRDEILTHTPSYQSSTLGIRYKIPR